jgi:DNA-binding CsgD family transcriptional regulator
VSLPLPPHGTYSSAVVHRCTCPTCHSYRRRRAYDRANGKTGRTDATQPRAHLERLVARGWSQDQIAAAAGLNQATISIILARQYAGVRRSTAAAILDIRLDQDPPIPRGFIDATGTSRRLQALMVLGHALPDIADQIGVSKSNLHDLAEGRWKTVRTATAGKVARVYRKLSTLPAPPDRIAELARNEAMARGWHGPMAWDNIDDPACQPDEDRPAAPQHVHADDVTELAARGLDDEEIGRRLRVSARTILRARTAHGIPAGVAA